MKKDFIPAVKKGGVKLGASKTKEFGVGDRYMFTWPITSLTEMDGPDPFEKALGPDGLVVLLANIQRCVEGTRTFMLNIREDLSNPPAQGYVHKMGVLVTNTVAPGRTDELEKNTKEMAGVIAKTNAKGFLVGKVGLGGNPNQYLSYVLFDSFADIEKFIPAYVKALAEAKIVQQPGVVTSTTMEVYGAIPEMTIE